MAETGAQGDQAKKRERGRPRALPVRTEALSDSEAFWRLKASRLENSFTAIRVLAFCSVWQRTGGTVEGVMASGYCGKRTVFTRLLSCHRAGFEPELVEWHVRSGKDWEEYEENYIRHMEDDLAREIDAYNRRPLASRLLRRKPEAHPDMLEDTTE